MECLHSPSRTLLIDDSVICSMCGKQIGFSNGYIPDPSHIECSLVQKQSTSGSGYSIRKPKDNGLSFALPAITAAVIRNPERLNQQSLVQQNRIYQYIHAPPGPYSSPRSRRHLVQHNRLSDDEVCLRSTEAPLLLRDILERMNQLPSGSCASRTSGRRGLRRKRRIPDNLHTPSNLDGTSPTGREMEPNGGPSVQGAGPIFESTMPPVEAAPFANLDGTAIESTSCLPLHDVVESSTLDKCGSTSFGIQRTTTDRESSRTDPTVPLGQPPLSSGRGTVLSVSSTQREIIPEDLEAAFAKNNFQISKILSKSTPFSAVVFFNNDEESYRALNSRIDYKGEVLSVSLADPKKERR